MMNQSTAGTNLSLISDASRRKRKQLHEYSKVAGKLYAGFELLCTVVRETQELAEDNREPIMREIGGTNVVAENGLLCDALHDVVKAASRAMDAAHPEEAGRIKSLRKRP